MGPPPARACSRSSPTPAECAGMAPISKLISTLLCGIGGDSNDGRPPSPPPPVLTSDHQAKTATPPHELPAFEFAAPLTAPELPKRHPPSIQAGEDAHSFAASPDALTPPVAPVPKLRQLVVSEPPSVSHFVIPPTPIDPLASPPPPVDRPATPSDSRSPVASTSSTPRLHPSSPNLTVTDPRSRSPHRPPRGHHRRSSSTGSRSFRETLNAFAVEGPDGVRSVNHYVLGEVLGRGSYATVEKAIDRETGHAYVRCFFIAAR